MELFVARAKRRRPDFDLNKANAAVVQQICELLEGLPLGIGLAASHLASEDIHAVHEGLRERMLNIRGLRAKEHHVTIGAAVEWSTDRLDRDEFRLLKSLSVFQGPFTSEAALAVAAAVELSSGRAQAIIRDLVDKSLVASTVTAAGTRYSLHQTIAVYARDRLAGTEDELRAGRALLRHFHAKVGRLRDTESVKTHQALAQQQANVLAALQWANLTDEIELGLEMAVGVGTLWRVRGGTAAASEAMSTLIRRAEGVRPTLRLEALLSAGAVAYYGGDLDRARHFTAEARALAYELSDMEQLGRALNNLGNIARAQGDLDAAIEYTNEAIAVKRSAQDKRLASSLHNSGWDLIEAGRPRAAIDRFREAYDIWRREGATRSIGEALVGLGAAAANAGDTEAALARFEEAVALQSAEGNRVAVANARAHLGELQARIGAFDEAVENARESLREAQKAQDPWGVAVGQEVLATALLGAREFSEAREVATAAIASYDNVGVELGRSVARTTLAAVEIQSGRSDRAEPLLLDALHILQEQGGQALPLTYLWLAALQIQDDELEAASATLVKVLRTPSRYGSRYLALAGLDVAAFLLTRNGWHDRAVALVGAANAEAQRTRFQRFVVGDLDFAAQAASDAGTNLRDGKRMETLMAEGMALDFDAALALAAEAL